MNIRIEGTSHLDYTASKQEFDEMSGLFGGICYMPETFDILKAKPQEIKLKRAESVKENRHHSCMQHPYINLVLEDIPKFLAMILNNEKMYNTSEKSARYTKMKLSDREQAIYDKWLITFLDLINKKYPKGKYNSQFWGGDDEKRQDSKRMKLAQENARYLTNVFTPTTMAHTISYGQLNYLYVMLKQELDLETESGLRQKAKPYIKEFLQLLDETGYIDPKITCSEKYRKLSIFTDKTYTEEEYFGDVYCTTYPASFAELAQAQRHRTIAYSFKEFDTPQFFVPPIIRDDEALVKMWNEDMASLADLYPQGTLVQVNEKGTLDNFILKMKERKCSFAQLEINEVTSSTLKHYVKDLKLKKHPYADELEKYDHGSRCTFPDYECMSRCGFAEGINETREI